MRPFLKWAGGKYRILDRIKQVIPPGKRLVEPFVGSGALFLNSDYPNYLLADTNKDLISLYICLQNEGLEFISYCKTFFTPDNNVSEKYYEFRTLFNSSRDVHEKAALFLFLNRHCYNGLCRYNSKGKFNVPFGRYRKPYFPEQEMFFFYQKSETVEFCLSDFRDTMKSLRVGDVVYCDPPYVPLSNTANFNSYSSDKFSLSQQKELAQLAEDLSQKGITVVISNHNTEITQSAYANATDRIYFDVQRFISSNGKNRQSASEVLAIFS